MLWPPHLFTASNTPGVINTYCQLALIINFTLMPTFDLKYVRIMGTSVGNLRDWIFWEIENSIIIILWVKNSIIIYFPSSSSSKLELLILQSIN